LDHSDNHCRHRGSDERDAPLLLEADALAGEGDVVIGGEQGDQAEDKAADSLVEAEAVEAEAPEALVLGFAPRPKAHQADWLASNYPQGGVEMASGPLKHQRLVAG
jgi:hypothetical protein